jgi:cytochrome P450
MLPGARGFRVGRPAQQYPHFGRDTHSCLGAASSHTQMQEIATALLRRPTVKRTSRLKSDGPFPDRLPISFDA